MVDILLKIVDPEEHVGLGLTDPNLKQIVCQTPQRKDLVYIKIAPFALIKKMKELKANFETIVFTCLPRKLVEEIFKSFPELEQVFDFVFY
jgi:hypothetical protein